MHQDTIKKQENMAQSKEKNKSPETDPKEKEIYELPDKNFKIIILKELNKQKKTQIDN